MPSENGVGVLNGRWAYYKPARLKLVVYVVPLIPSLRSLSPLNPPLPIAPYLYASKSRVYGRFSGHYRICKNKYDTTALYIGIVVYGCMYVLSFPVLRYLLFVGKVNAALSHLHAPVPIPISPHLHDWLWLEEVY